MQSIELSNRVRMPQIGLDLRDVPEEPARELIDAAIAAGWRFFCVSPGSRTAEALGRAVRESGLPRTEFFLITSLSADLGTYSAASAEVHFEVRLLGQFLDAAVADAEGLEIMVPEDVEELWRVLEAEMAQGKVRALGVHGFTAAQTEYLCADMALAPQILLAGKPDLTPEFLALVRHYDIQLLLPCSEEEASSLLSEGASVLLRLPEGMSPADWISQLEFPSAF